MPSVVEITERNDPEVRYVIKHDDGMVEHGHIKDATGIIRAAESERLTLVAALAKHFKLTGQLEVEPVEQAVFSIVPPDVQSEDVELEQPVKYVLPEHDHKHDHDWSHEHPPHEHPHTHDLEKHEHPHSHEHDHPLPKHEHDLPGHKHDFEPHEHVQKPPLPHEHEHSHELPEHAHPYKDHEHPVYSRQGHHHDDFALKAHVHAVPPVGAHGHFDTDRRVDALEDLARSWKDWSGDAPPHEHPPHDHPQHDHDQIEGRLRNVERHEHFGFADKEHEHAHDHKMPEHSHPLPEHGHAAINSVLGRLEDSVADLAGHDHYHTHDEIAALADKIDVLSRAVANLSKTVDEHSHSEYLRSERFIGHEHPHEHDEIPVHDHPHKHEPDIAITQTLDNLGKITRELAASVAQPHYHPELVALIGEAAEQKTELPAGRHVHSFDRMHNDGRGWVCGVCGVPKSEVDGGR